MDDELSIREAIDDPLIAQILMADGISAQGFASILAHSSEAYRATAIRRLHERRADLFYSMIGAGALEGGAARPAA